MQAAGESSLFFSSADEKMIVERCLACEADPVGNREALPSRSRARAST